MNLIIRGAAIYLFLLIIFRFLGKRSLAEITTFDFVLLLIISETTTNAMMDQDYSLTGSFVMICTLIGLDLIFILVKSQSKLLDKITEGVPLVIVDRGKPLVQRMKKSQVEEEDILEAARLIHGLEKMSDIKYAVLEKDGSISIIPKGEKE